MLVHYFQGVSKLQKWMEGAMQNAQGTTLVLPQQPRRQRQFHVRTGHELFFLWFTKTNRGSCISSEIPWPMVGWFSPLQLEQWSLITTDHWLMSTVSTVFPTRVQDPRELTIITVEVQSLLEKQATKYTRSTQTRMSGWVIFRYFRRKSSRFDPDRGLLSVWSFAFSYICIGFLQVLLYVVDAGRWFGVYMLPFDGLASHLGCILA